jgi:hypothetical protein
MRRETYTQALMCSRDAVGEAPQERGARFYNIEKCVFEGLTIQLLSRSMQVRLEVKPGSNAGGQDDHFARVWHTTYCFLFLLVPT